jgi:predicted secreted Zn-dependent protease
MFLVCLFAVVGCTMTKRVHQPGYHIEWKTRSIRNINVADRGPLMKEITKQHSTTTLINNDATATVDSSIMATTVLEEQSSITVKKKQPSLNTAQLIQPKKLVHEVGKQISTIKSAVKSTNNRYIGATRADLLVRIGLILLLVAAITIGIGLLFIVFWGDLAWIIGVILILIGVGALIASLLILLFSLIVFLLFG